MMEEEDIQLILLVMATIFSTIMFGIHVELSYLLVALTGVILIDNRIILSNFKEEIMEKR